MARDDGKSFQEAKMTRKLIVRAEPPLNCTMIEAIDAAVRFAYITRSVVEFEHEGRTFRAWYEDVRNEPMRSGNRAAVKVKSRGNVSQQEDGFEVWRELPRDHDRWGELKLDIPE